MAYLAAATVPYEQLQEDPASGRAVVEQLARLVGRPAATVKGHIVRARREGYHLAPGKTDAAGGRATGKAGETTGGATRREIS